MTPNNHTLTGPASRPYNIGRKGAMAYVPVHNDRPRGGDSVRRDDGWAATQKVGRSPLSTITISAKAGKGAPTMWGFIAEFVVCPIIALAVFAFLVRKDGGDGNPKGK